MSIALLSGISFMKTTLAGAAGTVIPPIAIAGDSAGVQGGAVPNNASLSRLTLSEASQLVHAKKVSPVELTRACLGRIEPLNPKLNAFITVTADSALAEARSAEAEIHRGHWKGPLHGIPLALKDLLDTAGTRTTAGSGLFKDRVPTEDAEVVRRLKAAGGVLLGKLNLHEFAYGGSSVSVISARFKILGNSTTVRGAPPPDRQRLSQLNYASGPLVPIREAPSASRQATAASLDSNRPMDG